jgi:hypothetical protein
VTGSFGIGELGPSLPGTEWAPTSSLPTLTQIRLLVSAGADERPFRKIASNAIVRASHMLIEDRNARHTVTEWNYELDPAREEPAGHLADRSLVAVERCELVVAVIGRTVGQTTRREIHHVYELRSLGRPRGLWLFAHKRSADPPTTYTALAQLVAEIEIEFGRTPLYHEVRNALDFQASLITQLIPYVLERAGMLGPSGGPAQ